MADKKTYKELKQNTVIIAIANIGSKAIAFIMAPIYSYYLTTSQYGTSDLLLTTSNLLIPIFCLDVYEATFRYSNDKDYDENKIISSSFFICFPGIIVSILVIFVAFFLFKEKVSYIFYTMAYVILGACIRIESQFARGQKNMRVFGATGIINALALFATNMLFLVILKKGLKGWLFSYLTAQLITSVYLCFKCKIYKKIRLSYVDRSYIKLFLRFCFPLIPTASMWWVMNASDRYMITFFLGISSTGIYSVANKMPAILSVFENVFYQSWQTTAISTIEDEDRDRLYSDVFNRYFHFLTIGVIGLLLIGKPMIIILFAKDYNSAWIPLAPLIVGVLIHALAGNLGSLYSVFKSTNGALVSALVGAVSNIVLNMLIIPVLGIVGAAVTTLVGYIITLVFRWFDVRKFVSIRLNKDEAIICLLALIVQFVLYYMDNVYSYVLRASIFFFMIIKYRKILYKFVCK